MPKKVLHILTIGEAADILDRSETRVRQLIEAGKLEPVLTTSGRVMVTTASVNARKELYKKVA